LYYLYMVCLSRERSFLILSRSPAGVCLIKKELLLFSVTVWAPEFWLKMLRIRASTHFSFHGCIECLRKKHKALQERPEWFSRSRLAGPLSLASTAFVELCSK